MWREPGLLNKLLSLSARGLPLPVSHAVIVTLSVISFLAIAAYCLVVAWPKLNLLQAAARQAHIRNRPSRVVRSLYDMGEDKPTERPRLLKK